MKTVTLWLIAAMLVSSLSFAQSPLQKFEGAESLSGEQFADIVKSVWDALKKSSDGYANAMKSKNDFETTQEFQARMQREREIFREAIVKYSDANSIGTRTFPVLMNVELRTYDADKQTYGMRSSSSVIVPPSGERVEVTCAANPYVLIRSSNKRGYKFAHVVMNTNPEFIWHVNNDMARAAKDSERNIFFKVWFRFDIAQTSAGTSGRLLIVPEKIALINTANNTTYWTDTIAR